LPDPLPPRVSAVTGAPWYLPGVHFRRAVEGILSQAGHHARARAQ
jgi:hypothetical protein